MRLWVIFRKVSGQTIYGWQAAIFRREITSIAVFLDREERISQDIV